MVVIGVLGVRTVIVIKKQDFSFMSLKKAWTVEFISKDLNLDVRCPHCSHKFRIKIKLEELIPFDIDCDCRCNLCQRNFRIVFSEKEKK